MPTKPGNGGHGQENYDPKTGKYTDGSENSQSGEEITKIDMGADDDIDFDLFEDDDNFDMDIDKWSEEMDFWQSTEKRDPNWVVDNIDKYFTKDVMNFVEKYGFHSYAQIGGVNSTWYSNNYTLTNAIANQFYQPMTPMDPQEFDDLKRQIAYRGDLFQRGSENLPLVYIERGFGNKGVINQSYLGIEPNELLLTDGAYGSCVYTAYSSGTASSYSNGRYIMRAIIDNTKGNAISDTNVLKLKNVFSSRMDEIKRNIVKHAIDSGRSQSDADKLAGCFEKTMNRDATFAALICGYDVVYANDPQYALLLRFRNVSVRKDW